MKTPYSKFVFLSSVSDFKDSQVVILGVPWESSTAIPGTRLAPNRFREASWLIETYSPYQERDLKDIRICDLGNLLLPPGKEDVLNKLRKEISSLLKERKKFVLLGGDHSITLGLMGVIPSRVKILHLDAHADRRHQYRGDLFNHATVIRRLEEEGLRVQSVGVRSRTPEEVWEEVNIEEKDEVYISLDLDIFDPSQAPAVSNPEPGGWFFRDFLDWLEKLPPFNLIGFDIVELNPLLEGSHITAVMGAVLIRELILKFWG